MDLVLWSARTVYYFNQKKSQDDAVIFEAWLHQEFTCLVGKEIFGIQRFAEEISFICRQHLGFFFYSSSILLIANDDVVPCHLALLPTVNLIGWRKPIKISYAELSMLRNCVGIILDHKASSQSIKVKKDREIIVNQDSGIPSLLSVLDKRTSVNEYSKNTYICKNCLHQIPTLIWNRTFFTRISFINELKFKVK